MAANKYYGPIKMGKLVVVADNVETPISVPQNPNTEWDDNDVFKIVSYKQSLKVVDHNIEDGYQIKWHKVLYKDTMYLICDRIMAIDTAMSLRRDYIDKEVPITLGGRNYLLTSMGEDVWDDVIKANSDIEGIPKPNALDANTSYWEWPDEKYTTPVNLMWNYVRARTVVYEEYSIANNCALVRGDLSPSGWRRCKDNEKAGYRPVLKMVPFNLSISGEDIDLGTRPWPFLHTYKVSLGYKEDPVNFKVYLDGYLKSEEVLTRDIDKQFDISPYWNDLELGSHTLSLQASDVDTSVTRNITFYKSANKPELLPDKPSMEQVSETIENTGYYIDYLKTKAITYIKETISKIY